jgi:hypothetical protein
MLTAPVGWKNRPPRKKQSPTSKTVNIMDKTTKETIKTICMFVGIMFCYYIGAIIG